MRSNRRNYYRILHVQPEAPVEVIKASYRTLMSRLKMHPDLGGDHEMAVLVNEAYATLSDPERRAAYDREIRKLLRRARNATWPFAAQPGGGDPDTSRGPAPGAEPRADRAACWWCETPARGPIRPNARCQRCHAPIARPPDAGIQPHELFGRRQTSRQRQAQLAIMQRSDGGATVSVRLHDVSHSGLGIITTVQIAAGVRVRIQTAEFEAVARVVASARERGEYRLHAELLGLAVARHAGVSMT